jgi:hypothetical protein
MRCDVLGNAGELAAHSPFAKRQMHFVWSPTLNDTFIHIHTRRNHTHDNKNCPSPNSPTFLRTKHSDGVASI